MERDREITTPEPVVTAAAAAAVTGDGFLSKQQIMEAKDVTFEIVDVPEWGGKVRVKVMTGPERDQWELANIDGRGKLQKFSFKNVRAITAAFTIVDENGKRMFETNEIMELAKKSGPALDRVWTVASRLNKLTQADVEELAGNSDSGHSDDS